MGRVRFGLRSGFFFLGLAAVAAPLAMTTNAAEGRHHRDILRKVCMIPVLLIASTPHLPLRQLPPRQSASRRNCLKRRAPSSS